MLLLQILYILTLCIGLRVFWLHVTYLAILFVNSAVFM